MAWTCLSPLGSHGVLPADRSVWVLLVLLSHLFLLKPVYTYIYIYIYVPQCLPRSKQISTAGNSAHGLPPQQFRGGGRGMHFAKNKHSGNPATKTHSAFHWQLKRLHLAMSFLLSALAAEGCCPCPARCHPLPSLSPPVVPDVVEGLRRGAARCVSGANGDTRAYACVFLPCCTAPRSGVLK